MLPILGEPSPDERERASNDLLDGRHVDCQFDGPAPAGGKDGPGTCEDGMGGGRMGWCEEEEEGGRVGRAELEGEVSGDEERRARFAGFAGVGIIAVGVSLYLIPRPGQRCSLPARGVTTSSLLPAPRHGSGSLSPLFSVVVYVRKRILEGCATTPALLLRTRRSIRAR